MGNGHAWSERPAEGGTNGSALSTALDYLYGRINYERQPTTAPPYRFRLTRMRRLLDHLGNPSRSYSVVHIGGTKGKGSACTMVAAMLSAGGHRTGLYTSPHLVRLEERFRVDGVPCPEEIFIGLVAKIKKASDLLEKEGAGRATFFELTTALAFQYFHDAECDTVVLEVGLGGRLDSTNVCTPRVTAITSIGFDHQHILGNTLEAIATEKAGIIKPGVPVISGTVHSGAAGVIESTAHQAGSPIWQLGRDFSYVSKPVDSNETVSFAPHQWTTSIDYRGMATDTVNRTDWSFPLAGAHQGHNAAIALATMDALAMTGLSIPLKDQRTGLANVVCQARIERFPGNPEIILDTAHNEESIDALCKCLAQHPGTGSTAFVFGTSRDKPANEMLTRLVQQADCLILTRYQSNPRALDPVPLAEAFADASCPLDVQSVPEQALAAACRFAGSDGRIVVCGSFYLAAEIRPLLVQRCIDSKR